MRSRDQREAAFAIDYNPWCDKQFNLQQELREARTEADKTYVLHKIEVSLTRREEIFNRYADLLPN